MRDLNGLLEKQNLTLLGSLIKVNRIRQNMSQQHLAQGICVPSYLSKIENGEVVPSLDIIESLFDELDIRYYSDSNFLRESRELIDEFFDELNLNGFVKSGEIFERLVKQEDKFIHSPLIVDYYLVHFAKFCSTSERDKFDEVLMMIQSIEHLLTNHQRFKYYFYLGLDQLLYYRDATLARDLLLKSTNYETTGHSLLYLAMAYYKLSSYYEAFEFAEKSYQTYLDEGNLIGLIGFYHFKAVLCYKVGSTERALRQYERSVTYMRKLNRLEFLKEAQEGQTFMLSRLNQSDEPLVIEDTITSQILTLCENGDKSQIDELQDLITKYKEQRMSNLLYDECLYESVIKFYVRNRMYKDAYLLTGENHL